VVEVNPIRHLTHLLLKIPSANESFIKTSLLNSFRTLKCEKERLEVNLSNTQMQLSNQSSGRAKEMERIKNEYELLLRENDIKSRKEIEQEKEKLNEMSLREADHKQKIEELESRLFEVEEKYKREDELRCEGLVHTNGELQKRLFMLEKAMREKDNELEKTKEYLVEEQSKLKKYRTL
jgi:spindle assembly abnormal protein 6